MKKKNASALCANCMYWYEYPKGGQCRRESPKVNVMYDGEKDIYGAKWPGTFKQEWCGQHPNFLREDDADKETT